MTSRLVVAVTLMSAFAAHAAWAGPPMAQAQSRYAMGGMVLVTQFSATRKRFMERMGRDLVLLTVSFDPNRGTPERLADRQGAIAASIEGNQYAAGQLGDLIETVLRR